MSLMRLLQNQNDRLPPPDDCFEVVDEEGIPTGDVKCFYQEVIRADKVINECTVNECPVFVFRPLPGDFVQAFNCFVEDVSNVICNIPENNFVVVRFDVTIRWSYLNTDGNRVELVDTFTVQQVIFLDGANRIRFEEGILNCDLEPDIPFVQCLAVEAVGGQIRFTLGKAFILKLHQIVQLEILARIPELPEPCEVQPGEEVCPPFLRRAELLLEAILIPPQPRFNPTPTPTPVNAR